MSSKLEQDHDCVIDIIKSQFLNKPLHNQTLKSRSTNISRLSTAILRLMRNQVNTNVYLVVKMNKI